VDYFHDHINSDFFGSTWHLGLYSKNHISSDSYGCQCTLIIVPTSENSKEDEKTNLEKLSFFALNFNPKPKQAKVIQIEKRE
jgi:hypothetical protein